MIDIVGSCCMVTGGLMMMTAAPISRLQHRRPISLHRPCEPAPIALVIDMPDGEELIDRGVQELAQTYRNAGDL